MPKKKKGNAQTFKQEEELQAVVLADSFTVRFRPFTATKPKVLLPLVNVPMIEYTLEFLCASGVKEVIVVCTAHHAQVTSYLQNSRWCRMAPQFRVRPAVLKQCRNLGIALQALDDLDWIKSDFVLISGDVVSNMRLEPVLAAHRARAKADPMNIMTMVFKTAAPDSRTRTLDDDTVLVRDSNSGQLLGFENDIEDGDITIPLEILQETDTGVEVRYDLMDCHIDICHPTVLALFKENFDWENRRKDLLDGILKSDICGYKINTHVVSGDYAARVQDLRTYDSVSKDVIRRWTHPMVPDNNIIGGSSYTYHRRNIYREQKVRLQRTATIEKDTVLGSGTSVGANSVITTSVIGRNCTIGANVTIEGSYLWEGCVIEDGVTITRALLAEGVTVRANTTISRGAVLGENVTVGSGVTVPAYQSLTNETQIDAVDTKSPQAGSARVYELDSDDDVEIIEKDGRMWKLSDINSIAPPPECAKISLHYDDDDLKDFDNDVVQVTENLEEQFFREIKATLIRGAELKDTKENNSSVGQEMVSLKLSYDATLTDYAMASFLTFFEMMQVPADDPAWKFKKRNLAPLKRTVARWAHVLSKFAVGCQEGMLVVIGLEGACASQVQYEQLFQWTLQELYENGVTDEQAIFEWRSLREESEQTSSIFLQKAAVFLEWLKNEAESSSSSDGSGSGSGSGSDSGSSSDSD